jgi:hypothetical protein
MEHQHILVALPGDPPREKCSICEQVFPAGTIFLGSQAAPGAQVPRLSGTGSLYRKYANHWGEKCWYCLDRPMSSVDHVLPRAAGGSNAVENIRPSCGRCNGEKGHLHPDDWALIMARRHPGFSWEHGVPRQ